MRRRYALFTILLLVAVIAYGQSSLSQFPLYKVDDSCSCIRTKKETKTARAVNITVGTSVYQVFHERTKPDRELFRVKIGEVVNSQVLTRWNYGIVDEGDFNGDGLPDYSWYGGDDSGDEMYLFLSSSNGYKRINVYKTLQVAWTRQFHTQAPDFTSPEPENQITDIHIERIGSKFSIVATVENQAVQPTEKHVLRIERISFER
jgi:hypothetical protein